MTDLERLVERVARLERSNRWLQRAAAGLVGVVGLLLLLGADSERPKTLEAQTFVLVDAEGRPRWRLEMSEYGPVMRFLDAQQAEVVRVATGNTGLTIRYFNPRKRLRTGLALQDDGVHMAFYDRTGKLQSGKNAIILEAGVFSRE
ncbi:MAG: hypothetical protein NZ700_03250 [Gemmataceae bacterium]|nr:hypothetical protein [Gemmataceae bacterium]MDW8267066.1 hypothetical protein [Gemmataceae bacterium]